MNYLTAAVPVLRHHLHHLLQQAHGRLYVPVGVRRAAEHLELLLAAPESQVQHVLLLVRTELFAVRRDTRANCLGVLLLGHGRQQGQARGVVYLPQHPFAPLHQLRLVGAGMPALHLHQESLPEPLARLLETGRDDPTVRWSRTIGALGATAWQRLSTLRCGIIGVGRTGSVVAQSLARVGVRHLTLIDPDAVELHNLGETPGLTSADLGRPKVAALADALAATAPASLQVVTVPTSITRVPALHAAQSCDVLMACVDHDSARLAASAIATMFCKPLVDIATGVHGHGPARHMGADVRLLLPGHCVLCCGGLRHTAEARHVLASAEAEQAFYAQRHWQEERAGSLASLNQYAASLGLRLLEDLIAAHVQDSTWIHSEFDATGRMSVSYPAVLPPLVSHPCPLCALVGWGEEGRARLIELLRQEHLWRVQPTGATT
jgi:hypothetical protein